MLKVIEDKDPDYFVKKVKPFLSKEEAVNSLLLGLASNLSDYTKKDYEPPILLRVESDGSTICALVQTPPKGIVLSRMAEEEVDLIIEFLQNSGRKVPGVVAPLETAELFAKKWSDKTSCSVSTGMAQGIYQLTKVIPPQKIEGECVRSDVKDAKIIASHLYDFSIEALPHEDHTREEMQTNIANKINKGRSYHWSIDGTPVASAFVGRTTENGVSIGGVYTPPQSRGKGYASSLVAAMSQKMLDEGKKFCFLFTDLSNPTSNKIYQNIGYEFQANFKHIIFD